MPESLWYKRWWFGLNFGWSYQIIHIFRSLMYIPGSSGWNWWIVVKQKKFWYILGTVKIVLVLYCRVLVYNQHFCLTKGIEIRVWKYCSVGYFHRKSFLVQHSFTGFQLMTRHQITKYFILIQIIVEFKQINNEITLL